MIPVFLRRLCLIFKFDNPIQILINRLVFGHVGPTIYQTGDLEVLVDHNAGDQDGTRSCLFPGLYDPLFEVADLPQGLNVLDLGANGGGFLLTLRKHGFEIRSAVAVELNPHTWSRLILNLYRNIPAAHRCLRILNGAAGGSDGSLRIALGRGSVSDSIVGNTQPGEEEFELPVYSLGTLADHLPADERINLCKIDIEGAEYGLLRQADHHLLSRIDAIVIEIHEVPGERPESLIRQLEEAGFQRIITQTPLIESNVHLFKR